MLPECRGGKSGERCQEGIRGPVPGKGVGYRLLSQFLAVSDDHYLGNIAATIPRFRKQIVDALVAERVSSDQPTVGRDETLQESLIGEAERRVGHERPMAKRHRSSRLLGLPTAIAALVAPSARPP